MSNKEPCSTVTGISTMAAALVAVAVVDMTEAVVELTIVVVDLAVIASPATEQSK